MKFINYKIVKTGNRVDYVGLSNTALIGALKTIRFNNRVLKNNVGVKEATKLINSLNRLKKLPNKKSYYARNKRLLILTKILNNFGNVSINKLHKMYQLKVPKIKVTDKFKEAFRLKRINISNYGGFSNDELENELFNMQEFYAIINSMSPDGKVSTAYKKYQHDVERLADRFGINIAATIALEK